MKTHSRFDRTGQVWEDKHHLGGVFVILEPGTHEHDGVAHKALVLHSEKYPNTLRTTWYEFYDEPEWEFDHRMERIA